MAGRVTQRDYGAFGSSTIVDSDTFSFDRASRLLSAISGRYTNTVSFTSDSAGRRASESLYAGGQTYTTSLSYDDASRLASMIYPDGDTVARTCTARGQLNEVKHNGTTKEFSGVLGLDFLSPFGIGNLPFRVGFSGPLGGEFRSNPLAGPVMRRSVREPADWLQGRREVEPLGARPILTQFDPKAIHGDQKNARHWQANSQRSGLQGL